MSDEWNKEMENTPSQPGEGDATPFEKPVQQESDTCLLYTSNVLEILKRNECRV